MRFGIPSSVYKALMHLADHGFTACLVGGCVRALLMDSRPNDFDITTNALPEQILELFKAFKTIDTGIVHGTVMVIIDHCPIEITTFRIDGLYSDRRRPDQVSFTDRLEADLSRRDFTINAMALPILSSARPIDPVQGASITLDFEPDQVIDPFCGRQDITNRLIRCVGQADLRFSEDALRILRALRFAATLGFSLEAGTAEAIHRKAPFLRQIARERVLAEMRQLLCGAWTASVLNDFFDVLGIIMPELLPLAGCAPHLAARRRQTIATVAGVPAVFSLRMAALLLNVARMSRQAGKSEPGKTGQDTPIDAAMAAYALERLHADRATIRHVMGVMQIQAELPEPALPAVKQYLRKVAPEMVLDGLALKKADLLASESCQQADLAIIDQITRLIRRILAEKQCFRLQDLAVNGHDLLQLGLTSNRTVGIILERLLTHVIEGRYQNDKTDLLQAAAREIEELQ
jgi:tRNA nucleotidyltransferase (CCA-adding enzyme)